jgi:lipopolysaccharide transport system ATP-binding protein
MTKVIKVENLSKAYRLGEIGTGTISKDLERFWARMRGKEDPFLKIGEINDRTVKGGSDVVLSLKDINFEIEQGDAVGIIGRNGAGKSTLLKVLSRVTAPTTGSVKIKGRIASLLEVGTGFHPELTGKENIFLNGAILGMRKAEIKRKFDEIVDFSGVDRYIDTPVKRYSSGMYVRLAFAVAAYLESEILIVDEVLAVGDAEFQKKCLGKMADISQGQGRTVLFVSHNMGAIKKLCNQSIILNNGSIHLIGNVNDGINAYTNIHTENKSVHYKNDNPEKGFMEIAVASNNNVIKSDFGFDENINLRIRFNARQEYLSGNIGIKVWDNLERCIFTSEKKINELTKSAGEITTQVTIPEMLLTPGNYKVSFALHVPNVQIIEVITDTIYFEVVETGSDFYEFNGVDVGCVFVNCQWKIIN